MPGENRRSKLKPKRSIRSTSGMCPKSTKYLTNQGLASVWGGPHMNHERHNYHAAMPNEYNVSLGKCGCACAHMCEQIVLVYDLTLPHGSLKICSKVLLPEASLIDTELINCRLSQACQHFFPRLQKKCIKFLWHHTPQSRARRKLREVHPPVSNSRAGRI